MELALRTYGAVEHDLIRAVVIEVDHQRLPAFGATLRFLAALLARHASDGDGFAART